MASPRRARPRVTPPRRGVPTLEEELLGCGPDSLVNSIVNAAQEYLGREVDELEKGLVQEAGEEHRKEISKGADAYFAKIVESLATRVKQFEKNSIEKVFAVPKVVPAHALREAVREQLEAVRRRQEGEEEERRLKGQDGVGRGGRKGMMRMSSGDGDGTPIFNIELNNERRTSRGVGGVGIGGRLSTSSNNNSSSSIASGSSTSGTNDVKPALSSLFNASASSSFLEKKQQLDARQSELLAEIAKVTEKTINERKIANKLKQDIDIAQQLLTSANYGHLFHDGRRDHGVVAETVKRMRVYSDVLGELETVQSSHPLLIGSNSTNNANTTNNNSSSTNNNTNSGGAGSGMRMDVVSYHPGVLQAAGVVLSDLGLQPSSSSSSALSSSLSSSSSTTTMITSAGLLQRNLSTSIDRSGSNSNINDTNDIVSHTNAMMFQHAKEGVSMTGAEAVNMASQLMGGRPGNSTSNNPPSSNTSNNNNNNSNNPPSSGLWTPVHR